MDDLGGIRGDTVPAVEAGALEMGWTPDLSQARCLPILGSSQARVSCVTAAAIWGFITGAECCLWAAAASRVPCRHGSGRSAKHRFVVCTTNVLSTPTG